MNYHKLFQACLQGFQTSKTVHDYCRNNGLHFEHPVGYWGKHTIQLIPDELDISAWMTLVKGKSRPIEGFVIPFFDMQGMIVGLRLQPWEDETPIHIGVTGFFPQPTFSDTLIFSSDLLKVAVTDSCNYLDETNKGLWIQSIDEQSDTRRLELMPDVSDDLMTAFQFFQLKSIAVERFDGVTPPPMLELEESPMDVLPTDVYTLDIRSEHHWVMETEQVIFTIYGGIKTFPNDRLECTLKTSSPLHEPKSSFRSYVDLYNPLSIKEFIKNAAPRLTLAPAILEEYTNILIDALEKYRENNRKAPQRPKEDQRHQSEARALVHDPYALSHLQTYLEPFGQSVGTESSLLCAYIAMIGSIQDQPLSLGVSGRRSGTFLEVLASLLPPERVMHVGLLSNHALYYYDQQLRNKILIIDNISDLDFRAATSVNEIIRHGCLRKTIPQKNDRNRLQTNTLSIEGPITVAVGMPAFCKWSGKQELMSIALPEDRETEAKIIDFQRLVANGTVSINGLESNRLFLHAFFRQLQAFPVRIPFSSELTLPCTKDRPMMNAFYLKFMSMITLIHQYNRPVKTDAYGNRYLEAMESDWAYCNRLLREVFIQKSDELNSAVRLFLEQLKVYLNEKQLTSFRAAEVRESLKLAPTTLKRFLNNLLAYNYIEISSGNKHQGYEYKIKEPQEYTRLQGTVDRTLSRQTEADHLRFQST